MRPRDGVLGLRPPNFYHHGWPMSSAPDALIENLAPEVEKPDRRRTGLHIPSVRNLVAESYDPVANTFAAITPGMNTAREVAMATLLPNGKVLIAGGFNGSVVTSSTELYTP